MDIQKDFIKRLENYYGLVYVQDSTEDKNVCYADSSAIRFEYKWMFTKNELLTYLISSLKEETLNLESTVITF